MQTIRSFRFRNREKDFVSFFFFFVVLHLNCVRLCRLIRSFTHFNVNGNCFEYACALSLHWHSFVHWIRSCISTSSTQSIIFLLPNTQRTIKCASRPLHQVFAVLEKGKWHWAHMSTKQWCQYRIRCKNDEAERREEWKKFEIITSVSKWEITMHCAWFRNSLLKRGCECAHIALCHASKSRIFLPLLRVQLQCPIENVFFFSIPATHQYNGRHPNVLH